MSRPMLRRGFTRREVFAVIAIIGVLLGLGLPALQTAREAARRTQCNHNLTCIIVGLQNYHDAYKRFPRGAMHAGPKPEGPPPIEASLGPSWWYGVTPFLSNFLWDDNLSETQAPGGPVQHEFCANDLQLVWPGLNKFVPGYLRCPSSPLPQSETQMGPIGLPSYVGIAGGCDIDPQSPDYQTGSGVPPDLARPETSRKYWNRTKGTGATAGGIVTTSGMLPPCVYTNISCCKDGTSNTMIVAEQSDWLLDRDHASSRRYHGDPGWTVGGTGPGGGWLSGTKRADRVPWANFSDAPRLPQMAPPWGADCWNITTVRYPPNYSRVLGATPLPGCSENHGINNPLQSPHSGGLLIGMTDASVQFLGPTTDLAVLLRLAIRNDGQCACIDCVEVWPEDLE